MAAIAMFDASDDIIEVIADSGQGSVLSIHRSLLLNASDYLRCIAGPFLNDSDNIFARAYGRVIITTEVPSDVMRFFVQWLYTGTLTQAGLEEILEVFNWTGHQLHNTSFRDFLVDKTISLLTSSRTPSKDVYTILDHIDNVDGGMLMFLTDWIVHANIQNNNTLYAEIGERVSLCQNADAIYRGLAQSFLEAKVSETSLTPWRENRCAYHEHAAVSCCDLIAGSEKEETAMEETYTPPPAPVKRRSRRNTTPSNKIEETPTRRSLRNHTPAPKALRGKAAPPWTYTERLAALKQYLKYPSASHTQIVAKHNHDFCAIRGYERSAGALGMQYRELMGGSLEETREMIGEKVKELEWEAKMEEDEEMGNGVW